MCQITGKFHFCVPSPRSLKDWCMKKLFECINSSVSYSIWISEKSLELATIIIFLETTFSTPSVITAWWTRLQKTFTRFPTIPYYLSLVSWEYVEITTTWQTRSGLFQSMVLIHQFSKSLLVFHRVVSWVLCFSWFASIISQILSLHVIFSFLLMKLNVVSQSRPHLTIVVGNYVLTS